MTIDQSLIRTGFDLELLLSERYIKYFLLTSFDTGSLVWFSDDVDEVTGAVTHIIIHPPSELERNRLYDPRDDFLPHPFQDLVPVVFTDIPSACNVELLPDGQGADVRVTMIISIIAPPFGTGNPPVVFIEQDMTMDAKFFINVDPTTANASLRLEVVDINGPFVDKAKTLKTIKDMVDRDLPLPLAAAGAVGFITSQKFFAEDPDDPPTCLALYVNLNLKNGPEPDAFFGPRGDLGLSKNFLPKGHDLAFGFAGDLYEKLGSDIFQRMAKPKEGGGFFYPLDPDNPDTGHVKSVAVLSKSQDFHGPSSPADQNALVIRVKGEYAIEDFFDPDFTMRITMFPFIDDKGVLTFNPTFDLNIPSIGWLVVGTALLGFLSVGLAIPTTLAALAAKAIVEDLGEDKAVPIIKAQLDDASFFDSFPNKLEVEPRRWDPLYFTSHQIVSLVKEVLINEDGMAFAAFDLRVGKEAKPVEDAIIRSEVRDPLGDVSGLLYRIKDWSDEFEAELDLVYPATDRMDFEEILPPDGGVEATRVHVTVEQAVDRIKAKRILEKILYTPYHIDERDHQIYQILTLSAIEVPEIQERARRLLRRELEQAHGAEFDQQAHDQLLAELGREPTADEIEARHNEILKAAVDAGADKRYRRERERFLKFDLEPFEYADLQQKKILVLEHVILEIIKMRDSVGGTVYYRDAPDRDKGDNLLSLPRYKSETIVRP
jgi:hypothetical protein